MANPIKTSDIWKDDGTLKQAQEDLKEILRIIVQLVNITKQLNKETSGLNVTNSKETDQLVTKAKQQDAVTKEVQKYLQALDQQNVKIEAIKKLQGDLNKANKLEAAVMATKNKTLANYNAQLKRAQQEYSLLTEEEKKSEKSGRKLESQIVRLTARINAQKKEQREQIKQRELELKVNKSAEGSYNRLSAQYSLLKIRLNAMSGASRKFTAEGQRLEKQSKAIYDEMKRLQEVTGKNQLNVGNYSDALSDLQPGLSGTIGRVKQVGNAFKALLANPIVALIAAITGAITLLYKSLKRSEEGQNALNKVMRIAGSIFDNIADVVTLTATAILNLGKGFDEVIRKLRGLRKEIEADIVAADQLAALEADFNRRERKAIVDIAKLRRSSEAARAEAEQLKFNNADKAIKKLEESFDKESEILQIQITQAKDKVRILEQESALAADDIAAKKAIAEATAAVVEAEGNFNAKIRERTRFLNQFRREALKQFQDQVTAGLAIANLRVNREIEALEEIRDAENATASQRAIATRNILNLKREVAEIEAEFEREILEKQNSLRIINAEELQTKLLLLEEQKKTDLLNAEKEYIEEIKKINQEFADFEGERLAEDIKEVEEELSRLDDTIDDIIDKGTVSEPRSSIYDFLGIKVGSEEEYKSELTGALDFAKQRLFEFASFRTQLADQAVENARRETEALEQRLQTELQLSEQGYANNVADVQRRLRLQREAEQRSLEQRRKAQRNELAIQTIEQATNLVTASTKLWAQFQLGAIPLIALMFGSFAATKIKAFQLAREEFSTGTYQEIGGGTHMEGRDTYVGQTASGKRGYAERGESWAVFNRKARRKYDRDLPNIVESLNRGDFHEFFIKAGEQSKDIEIRQVPAQSGSDMSKTEKELTKIRKQGERKFIGNREVAIEQYKSVTTYYR